MDNTLKNEIYKENSKKLIKKFEGMLDIGTINKNHFVRHMSEYPYFMIVQTKQTKRCLLNCSKPLRSF